MKNYLGLLMKENQIMKDQVKLFESKIVGLQNNVEFKLNIEYIQSEAK